MGQHPKHQPVGVIENMRKTIIGIVIGIVFGVMVGAVEVGPNLIKARQSPLTTPVVGAESLNTSFDETQASGQKQNEKEASFRIISLFPPNAPVLNNVAQHLATSLNITGTGRILATLHSPGTLVSPSDTVNAVTSGTVEAVYTAPENWDQSSRILQFFTSIPFGPNTQDFLAWFYQGGGQKLFSKIFKRDDVHAVLCGALPSFGSGWYQRPIRTVADFKGLKIRMQGLTDGVFQKLGVTTVSLKASEIAPAFEKGQLDGAEYGLPSTDAEFEFSKNTRNYYFPGWQHPTNYMALIINGDTWENLGKAGQANINTSCGDTVRYALALADSAQFEALKKISLSGIQMRRWPTPILNTFKSLWQQTARELEIQDSDFKTARKSLQTFQRDMVIWRDLNRL